MGAFSSSLSSVWQCQNFHQLYISVFGGRPGLLYLDEEAKQLPSLLCFVSEATVLSGFGIRDGHTLQAPLYPRLSHSLFANKRRPCHCKRREKRGILRNFEPSRGGGAGHTQLIVRGFYGTPLIGQQIICSGLKPPTSEHTQLPCFSFASSTIFFFGSGCCFCHYEHTETQRLARG